MKVRDLLENNVIRFPDRKKSMQDRVKDAFDSMPAAFQEQREAEEYVRDMLKQIDQRSEGRKAKYRHPTIMWDYRKGTHPFEALEYEIEEALGDPVGVHDRYLRDDEKQFIVNFAKEHINDIVRILQHDYEQYKSFQKYVQEKFKGVPAIQYVLEPFNPLLTAKGRQLEFFKNFQKTHSK